MKILSPTQTKDIKPFLSYNKSNYPELYEAMDKLEIDEAVKLFKADWFRYYKSDPLRWWCATRFQTRAGHQSRFLGKDFKIRQTEDSFIIERTL